ncbi:MAG: hypothetical protein AAB658_02215 [Chloroflexota bacterium]
MTHLLVFVLDNVDQYPAILEAWEAAGVPGVTILDSAGLGHLRERALRDDVPLLPSLSDLLPSQEINHRTLFSVIEDETVLKRVIAATQAVIGDFSRHHTGLLFVVPVTLVLGLERTGLE